MLDNFVYSRISLC